MAAPKRNYELKKSNLFIDFPFIWLNVLKSAKHFFHLKYSFCRLSDSAARGFSNTPPPPSRAPVR
jgi:hypothetical protein